MRSASTPVVVLEDAEAGRVFEACNVYKINGADRYLALIEAFDGTSDYRRYFLSWTADSLKGPWTPLHFFPTNKRLEEGMAYILDCSPVVDGYVSDIGYAGVLGDDPGANRIFDALMRDLAQYRTLILERIKAGDALSEVYAAVDALIALHFLCDAARDGVAIGQFRHPQPPSA